jgi:hypothetical protein
MPIGFLLWREKLTLSEIVRSIVEQDYAALVAVRRLVHHFDFERRQLIRVLFKHAAQVLDGHFEVFLIVFEYLSQVVTSQVVGKCISPLKSLTALLQGLGSIVKELNFDPGHAGCRLELRHLLLRLKVNVLVELGRLLVVGVAVVVVEVSLERRTALCLGVARLVTALFLEAIAVVPARAMF